MKRNYSSGQTMLEVVVAMSSAVVIIAAVVITVINGLNNAQFAKNQNLASNYAQQGMEIVRKTRDSTLYGFQNDYLGSGLYCLAKNDNVVASTSAASCIVTNACTANIDGIFIREVCINNTATNNDCPIPTPSVGALAPTPVPTYATQVWVKVRWSDSKCTSSGNLYCHESKLVSCFSDFNAIPTSTP